VRDIIVLKKFFNTSSSSSFGKNWILDRLGVVGGMKVSKPPRHTNCTTRLLYFDFELDATLLSFELASK
jgi:hypothetical protein